MLELQKLLEPVERMSADMAQRQRDYGDLRTRARAALTRHAQVDDALLDKIERVCTSVDLSWRGARPVGDRLDERRRPTGSPVDATLIGVDGSQIYPDRHGLAIYYLINTGVIVLRQGSGQAPTVSTRPQLFYTEDDLYADNKELVDTNVVNAVREMAELREMALAARAERAFWQGDLDRLVLALSDGPLLIWVGEKQMNSPQTRERIDQYLQQLQQIQTSGGIPIGYIDRPRSANVVRMLHIADMELTEMNKDTVRATRYKSLTDRELFYDLAPGERSAIFASTAEVNESHFKSAGQEIHFFYLNVAPTPDLADARIVRIDAPAWVTGQPELLDNVQQAILRDCAGADYPYVLARAHELAVVRRQERQEFEHMLAVAMWQRGLIPQISQKAFLKQLL